MKIGLLPKAAKSQLSNNPYTWRFKVYEGDTLNEFDAVNKSC